MEYIVFKALGILGALVLVAMYIMIIWRGILKLKDFILERKHGKRFLYELGRADAIDEFKDLLLKHKSKDEYPVMCFDEFTLNRLAEQLKEK